MKRQLTVLFAATGLLLPAAHAQSSVTIYGIVDAYGQFLDGASRVARLQSGGQSGSRLGFRGTEDLGAGLRATFTLESGLNVDEGTIGQSGAFFGRQAWVGLQSAQWGLLSFGRQYTSVNPATTEFSIFGNNTSGPSTALLGGFAGGYEPVRGASGSASPPALGATGNGGPTRANNSLRYETPSIGGLRASVLWGLGEVPGRTRDSRLWDLGLRYTNADADLILSLISDEAWAGGARVTDVTTVTAAGSYVFGPVRAMAGWMRVDDKRPQSLDGRGYWVGADWRMGSNLLKLQFIENKPRFGTDNRSRALGVGYSYDFSRRTMAYTSLTRFDNGRNPLGGGRFNGPIPAGLTTAGDADLTELVVGVRHSF